MKRWIHFWVIVALVLVWAGAAAAQGNNQIEVHVLDLEAKPLPDATIVLKSDDTGQGFTLKSDKNGKAVQLGLKAGIYSVTVTTTNAQIPPYQQKFVVKEGESGTLVVNFKEIVAKYGNSEEAKKREEEANAFKNMKTHFDAGVQAMNDAGTIQTQIRSAAADQKSALQEKRTTACQTAVTEFEQASKGVTPKEAKNYATVWSNLGAAYECVDRYQDAANAAQKIIDVQPNAPAYVRLSTDLANLGVAQTDPAAMQSKIADASAACDKAVALDATTTAMCWKNMGIVLYNKQHQKEAAVALQKASQAEPKDAQTWFLLGSSLAAQIDSKQEGGKEIYIIPPGTMDAYQKCIDAAPTGPYAPQCKAGLDELAQLSGGVQTTIGKKKH
ncbi:MAG TPA: SpaA isopeptide-forming pilin-related protein [Candidatus Acidoferrum sp.]|nr:SpaA isopeptide-forming pilin-related protein [Candidatus Acidoferrum sp.]